MGLNWVDWDIFGVLMVGFAGVLAVTLVLVVVLVLHGAGVIGEDLEFTVTEELLEEVKLLQRDVAQLKAEQVEYEKRLNTIYQAILFGTVHELARELIKKENREEEK